MDIKLKVKAKDIPEDKLKPVLQGLHKAVKK